MKGELKNQPSEASILAVGPSNPAGTSILTDQPGLTGPSILAIGNVCADQYLTENRLYPGGECANTAVFASRFGLKSGFIGMFGNDESAEMMRQTLVENGVDLSRCRYYDEESAFTRVKLVNNDRVFVESNSGGPLRHHAFDFTREDMDYIASFDLVYTGLHGYMESWIPKISEMADVCWRVADDTTAKRPLIAYDFSFRRDTEFVKQIAPHLTAALVSLGELSEAARQQVTDLLVGCGVRLVVGTMGKEGSMVITGGKVFKEDASPCAHLVDTNGAGDCFFASLLASLLEVSAKRHLPPLSEKVLSEENTVKDAMRKAARDAALICEMEGAYECGMELPLSSLRARADWKKN